MNSPPDPVFIENCSTAELEEFALAVLNGQVSLYAYLLRRYIAIPLSVGPVFEKSYGEDLIGIQSRVLDRLFGSGYFVWCKGWQSEPFSIEEGDHQHVERRNEIERSKTFEAIDLVEPFDTFEKLFSQQKILNWGRANKMQLDPGYYQIANPNSVATELLELNCISTPVRLMHQSEEVHLLEHRPHPSVEALNDESFFSLEVLADLVEISINSTPINIVFKQPESGGVEHKRTRSDPLTALLKRYLEEALRNSQPVSVDDAWSFVLRDPYFDESENCILFNTFQGNPVSVSRAAFSERLRRARKR